MYLVGMGVEDLDFLEMEEDISHPEKPTPEVEVEAAAVIRGRTGQPAAPA